MIKIPLCFMCKHYKEGDVCKAHPDGLTGEDFKLCEDKAAECGNGISFEPIDENMLHN